MGMIQGKRLAGTDGQEKIQAGEIEITPEMIEAGLESIWGSDPLHVFAPEITAKVFSDALRAALQRS